MTLPSLSSHRHTHSRHLLYLLIIFLSCLLAIHQAHASYDYYYNYDEDFDDDDYEDDDDDDDDDEASRRDSFSKSMPQWMHRDPVSGKFSPSDSPGVQLEHLKYPGFKLDIVNINNITDCELYLKYFSGEGRPFVLEGASSEWPAMQKWHNISNFFAPILNKKRVDVTLLRKLSEGIHSRRYGGTVEPKDVVDMPFERFYRKTFTTTVDSKDTSQKHHHKSSHRAHHRHHSKSNTLLYMNNWHFATHRPELMQDYQVPSPFRDDWSRFLPERYRYRHLWIYVGPAESYSQLHMDVLHTSAWLAPIRGNKLWYFFHPEYSSQFQYNPQQSLNQKHLIRYEHLLKPGQIMFVPSKWWHYVRNLPGDNEQKDDPENGASVAITQNFINASNLKYVYLQWMELENRKLSKAYASLFKEKEVQDSISHYDALIKSCSPQGASEQTVEEFLKNHSWHQEYD